MELNNLGSCKQACLICTNYHIPKNIFHRGRAIPFGAVSIFGTMKLLQITDTLSAFREPFEEAIVVLGVNSWL